eukprot:97724-Rhodomonas_salina.5
MTTDSLPPEKTPPPQTKTTSLPQGLSRLCPPSHHVITRTLLSCFSRPATTTRSGLIKPAAVTVASWPLRNSDCTQDAIDRASQHPQSVMTRTTSESVPPGRGAVQ